MPKLRDKMIAEVRYLSQRWEDIPEQFQREISLHVGKNLWLFGKHINRHGKKKWRKAIKVSGFDFKGISFREVEGIRSRIKDYLLLLRFIDGKTSPKEIFDCRNATIQAHMVEQYGIEKFFSVLKPKVIHSNGSSKLMQIRSGNGSITVVKVIDPSTNKTYLLQVPPHMQTCKQAIAWTFGLEPNEYNPLLET